MATEEQTVLVSLQDKVIALSYPAELDEDLWPLFDQFGPSDDRLPHHRLQLRSGEDGMFVLECDGEIVWNSLVWPHALKIICDEIERLLIAVLPDLVIQAGAVRHNGRSILVLGPAGSHKSEMVAWFVDRDFEYLADNFVGLHADLSNLCGERDIISPLAMPMALHPAAESELLSLPVFRDAYGVLSNGRIFIQHGRTAPDHAAVQHCGLVVVPKFRKKSPLAVEIVPPNEMRFLLAQAASRGRPLMPSEIERIAWFAQVVPAIAIRYGSIAQLGGIDKLARDLLDDETNVSNLQARLETWRREDQRDATHVDVISAPVQVPAPITATVRRYRKRLTIGMATFDDYDGVYFTIQSIRLHHAEVSDDIEFVVVDNNPDGICAPHLKALEKMVPNYRYVPVRERSGTAVRDYVMSEGE